VTTAFNTGPPSAGSQSPVRMRLIAVATSDLTEPVRLWLAGRLATAPASWRTPNASRIRRRSARSRQRVECGGLPPLWEVGRGELRPSCGLRSPRVEQGRSVLEKQEGRCARGNRGPAGGLSARASAAEEPSHSATAEGRAGPWGGGFELQVGFVSVAVDRSVFGSGQGV